MLANEISLCVIAVKTKIFSQRWLDHHCWVYHIYGLNSWFKSAVNVFHCVKGCLGEKHLSGQGFVRKYDRAVTQLSTYLLIQTCKPRPVSRILNVVCDRTVLCPQGGHIMEWGVKCAASMNCRDNQIFIQNSWTVFSGKIKHGHRNIKHINILAILETDKRQILGAFYAFVNM